MKVRLRRKKNPLNCTNKMKFLSLFLVLGLTARLSSAFRPLLRNLATISAPFRATNLQSRLFNSVRPPFLAEESEDIKLEHDHVYAFGTGGGQLNQGGKGLKFLLGGKG